MLERVCESINNYFVDRAVTGTYVIADGTMDLSKILTNGQRFMIEGSALNDGMYTYINGAVYDDDAVELVPLLPETFVGRILCLNIRRDFAALVSEIAEWEEANGKVASGPYQSESFGGYSYTKQTGAGGGAYTWRDAFKERLDKWRKICPY